MNEILITSDALIRKFTGNLEFSLISPQFLSFTYHIDPQHTRASHPNQLQSPNQDIRLHQSLQCHVDIPFRI